MSDLDAALEPVREILERGDARRANGRSNAEEIEKLLAAAARLEATSVARAPTGATAADWAVVEQNLADVREIVKKLRNGPH